MSVYIGGAEHRVSIRVPGLGSGVRLTDQYEGGQANAYFTTIQFSAVSDPNWALEKVRAWAQQIADQASEAMEGR